jgi:hypothetical protein
MHPDGHLRPGLAAEPIDRVIERHVQRRLVVDLRDAIEPLQARSAGRGARHRPHDGEHLVANGDDDAEPAEVARRGQVHLLEGLGTQEDAVGIESPQHAVARRVLDFPQIDFAVLQVALQEREHLAEPRGHVPGPLHVVDAELALVRVDPHLQCRRPFIVQHDDLCDLLLNLIERGQEHLPRLDPRGIDVLLADQVQGLVDGKKTGQIVGGLLRTGSRHGVSRTEPLPQASGSEVQR